MLRLLPLLLLAAPASAESLELQASGRLTATTDDGVAVGPGASLTVTGHGTWTVGARVAAWWFSHESISTDLMNTSLYHTRMMQVHVLAQHRVEELTLSFGLGVDHRAIDVEYPMTHLPAEEYRHVTYAFGGSIGIAYEVWHAGHSAIEVDVQLAISPLLDVLSFSGEYTAQERLFTASAGVAYRLRL